MKNYGSELLKNTYRIFKSPNFFFKYIKMSKTLSAKYYQDNKERLQKNP